MKQPIINYRTRFGLQEPQHDVLAAAKYMEGCGWYVLWVNCPDLENILATGFSSRKSAEAYILSKDYTPADSKQLSLFNKEI